MSVRKLSNFFDNQNDKNLSINQPQLQINDNEYSNNIETKTESVLKYKQMFETKKKQGTTGSNLDKHTLTKKVTNISKSTGKNVNKNNSILQIKFDEPVTPISSDNESDIYDVIKNECTTITNSQKRHKKVAGTKFVQNTKVEQKKSEDTEIERYLKMDSCSYKNEQLPTLQPKIPKQFTRKQPENMNVEYMNSQGVRDLKLNYADSTIDYVEQSIVVDEIDEDRYEEIEDFPVLPPKNNLFKNLSISVPQNKNIAFKSPNSTKELIKNDLKFCFDNVHKQKGFTEELLNAVGKQQNVYSSEVDEKIAGILYGEYKLQYDYNKENFQYRDKSRTSHLALQSEEYIDDFDDDEDDDGDNEDEDEKSNQFFGTILHLPADINKNDIPIQELLQNENFATLKWSHIMVKLNVDILSMSQNEIEIQNAKYELLKDERSFLKSMNVLYSQFVQKLFIVLTKNEQNKMFAYMKEIRDLSQSFCVQLEKCWTYNKFTEEFLNVICEFLDKKFDYYVHYSGSQIYSETLLGEIISDKNRDIFKELLQDIEAEHCTKGLHFHAYQLLPIRKVKSLPMFIENIFKCMNTYNKEYQQCSLALNLSKQLVTRCNKMVKEAKEHMRTKSITEKLVFPKNSSLKLNVNGNVHLRHLIKSEELLLVENNSTFYKKRISKTPAYVFLFNDIFVLAKKSSANKYMVLDYCFRINMELDRTPVLLGLASSVNRDTILYITIKENKDMKRTDLVLSCNTKTDQLRWIEVIDPPDTAKKNMQFNFENVKKVIVQRNYCAVHSDEINLSLGEIIKILRETDDGWSFGHKESDDEFGWFKSDHVVMTDDVKERVKKVKEKYNSRRQ